LFATRISRRLFKTRMTTVPNRLFDTKNPSPSPIRENRESDRRPCPPEIASDWLPLVRDLMASGLSLQEAVDHLADLAVAAHHAEQAQRADAFIEPLPEATVLNFTGWEGGSA